MGLYNNYGTGGAGSYNFGRKKREAQFNNFGSGGAGSYNYDMPMGGMTGMPLPTHFCPFLISTMELAALEARTTTMARRAITGEAAELVAITFGVNVN